MPIVATPATPVVIAVDEVRRFMRDYPDKNILLDDVEFSLEDINQGLDFVVGAYNAVTPISSLSVEGWPSNLRYLLLLGVSWYLIKSCAFLQLRNQATVQDGDIAPIGIDDKFPLYMQMHRELKTEWDFLVRQVKTQLNLESGYGCLSSGYRNTSRYHHS